MFAAGSVLSAAWLLYDRAVKVRSTAKTIEKWVLGSGGGNKLGWGNEAIRPQGGLYHRFLAHSGLDDVSALTAGTTLGDSWNSTVNAAAAAEADANAFVAAGSVLSRLDAATRAQVLALVAQVSDRLEALLPVLHLCIIRLYRPMSAAEAARASLLRPACDRARSVVSEAEYFLFTYLNTDFDAAVKRAAELWGREADPAVAADASLSSTSGHRAGRRGTGASDPGCGAAAAAAEAADEAAAIATDDATEAVVEAETEAK